MKLDRNGARGFGGGSDFSGGGLATRWRLVVASFSRSRAEHMHFGNALGRCAKCQLLSISTKLSARPMPGLVGSIIGTVMESAFGKPSAIPTPVTLPENKNRPPVTTITVVPLRRPPEPTFSMTPLIPQSEVRVPRPRPQMATPPVRPRQRIKRRVMIAEPIVTVADFTVRSYDADLARCVGFALSLKLSALIKCSETDHQSLVVQINRSAKRSLWRSSATVVSLQGLKERQTIRKIHEAGHAQKRKPTHEKDDDDHQKRDQRVHQAASRQRQQADVPGCPKGANRVTLRCGTAALLQTSGKHNVESPMQDLAILFETDSQRWFATRPGIFGDIGVVLEIKLCGERDMQ